MLYTADPFHYKSELLIYILNALYILNKSHKSNGKSKESFEIAVDSDLQREHIL